MSGRRRFLATVGMAAVAGCLGTNEDDGTGGDDGTNAGTPGNDPDGGTTAGEGSNGGTTGGGDPAGTDEAGGVTTTATTEATTTTAVSRPVGDPRRIAKGTQRINEEESTPHRWNINDPATLFYEFEVTEGPELDVLLFEEDQYELFRQGQSAEWIPGGSAVGSTGGRRVVELEPLEADYVLLFDNTRFGPTHPPRNGLDDLAVVDVVVDLYR